MSGKGLEFGTTLSPEQEMLFQRDMQFAPGYRDWYRQMIARFGSAELNSRNYDTRGAWLAGVVPQAYAHDNGNYHWDSVAPADPPYERGKDLKAPDHPTRWMQTFMEMYGSDPYEASPADLADAMRRGIVPNSRGVRGR